MKEALKLAHEELKHIKTWCLRSIGIGLVNENVLTKVEEALAQPEQTNTRPYYTIDELNAWADEKEKQAWRNAAIRIGEELSSVGPDGYYDMNAWQWLDWAMENVKKAQPEQEPVAWEVGVVNGVVTRRLASTVEQPQRTQVDLTDEEVLGLFGKFTGMTGKGWLDLYRMTEAKRKEKNT